MSSPVGDSRYWRLEYDEHGVRRQTTGGHTLESAQAAAARIIARLDAGAPANGRKKVREALDRYVVHLRMNTQPNHHTKTIPDLEKALRGLMSLRCEALTDPALRQRCDDRSARSSAEHVASRIRAFLDWGHAAGYFTESQARALRKYTWTPSKVVVEAPKRKRVGKKAGEPARLVQPDEVPTHESIASLGDAAGERVRWGKLFVELTHSAGPRSGEAFALAAPAVKLATAEIDIHRQALSVPKLKDRIALPKHGIIRTTNYPHVSTTGFPLHDALGERLEEVEWEQRRGINPHRLLFPTETGCYHWHSSFRKQVFNPAATEAGWERLTWADAEGQERGLWVHTPHSLRHRFARDRLDLFGYTIAELQITGGWQSAQVIFERYYGLSKEVRESATAKLLVPRIALGGGQ